MEFCHLLSHLRVLSKMSPQDNFERATSTLYKYLT